MDILLQRMQENPSIAGGYTKESKQDVTSFLKNLNNELNSAGPPVKSVFEWKKVWTDQKRYVHKKAAANVRERDATGGGPYKMKTLSPTEESIYELVKMRESVEGVQNSSEFGVPIPSSSNKENELPSYDIVDEIIEEMAIEEVSPNRPSVQKRKAVREDTRRTLSTAELIEKEVVTQDKLCSKVCELIDLVKDGNAETQNMMNRMCKSLEKLNDNQRRTFKELQRHNTVMEQYRKMEIESKLEINKKLVEVEDIKISLMRGNE